MTLLLVFACVLLLAVLLSSLAHRTILSTAALFLIAGFVLGDGVLGVVSIGAADEVVAVLAELALFAVLFTDGMRLGWAELRSAWRLPGRALGWGLPLTLIVTALGAHYLIGLGWIESLLIGAILAPTDPVFAAALVGNEKCRPGCGNCSTSSPASTTAWRCRSSWCSWPWPPAPRTCTWASSAWSSGSAC
nr:hypothetical protein GCM10020093_001460 [Planobispora longispora]